MLLIQYFLGDQMEKHEMGRTCSTIGEMCIQGVGVKNSRLCRATAASFYVNTSLRAERNELNPFMNKFIY